MHLLGKFFTVTGLWPGRQLNKVRSGEGAGRGGGGGEYSLIWPM